MKKVAIIGGGAAGFFAAVNIKKINQQIDVVIFEAQTKALTKVKVSGGGRCNLTNHCMDLELFSKNYPRGEKFMRRALHHFGPKNTIEWFERHGVALKVEKDLRIFPLSNSSQSIIECLQSESQKLGILRLTSHKIVELIPRKQQFELFDQMQQKYLFDEVVVATGSSDYGFQLLEKINHPITPRVPSLFTFKISQDQRLKDMAGVSFEKTHLQLSVPSQKKKFEFYGPLMITHWGLSGPAVLKLSAWGAASLCENHYQGQLKVNFVAPMQKEQLFAMFSIFKKNEANKKVIHWKHEAIATRFWQNLLKFLGIADHAVWQDLSMKQLQAMSEELTAAIYMIEGKGIFKEEFVTCGGVPLNSVDNKTLESKLHSGLYFAGEVLDIDGITGGFNLQNAWTTAYLVAKAISEQKKSD